MIFPKNTLVSLSVKVASLGVFNIWAVVDKNPLSKVKLMIFFCSIRKVKNGHN